MAFASASAPIREKIEAVDAESFEATALEVFQLQARENPLYREFLRLTNRPPEEVKSLADIPFLPIRFFKTHDIQTGRWRPQLTFTSSGTTSKNTSRHLLRDLSWYERCARRGFAHFYGDPQDYCLLALLPAYLERRGSSLVYMVDFFIRQSRDPRSGFFLNNIRELLKVLQSCQKEGTPTLLLGVSFALLDLAEQWRPNLQGVIVMETGGMKGRRREMTREELHAQLIPAFKVAHIHSEYGMTELLSQAYSQGGGLFYPAPTMRVQTRDITDPFSVQRPGRSGALNIIDLANIDTISFIATDDLGRVYADGGFEVLGRMDGSDVRGCNLMLEAGPSAGF